MFCWVMGTYKGVTGWVPVQGFPLYHNAYVDALCGYYTSQLQDVPPPSIWVADDGSPTGCAELTPVTGCFPADATVLLKSGLAVPLSELQLGDEVAVRLPDGTLGYEAVYAFGHRDRSAQASFVDLQVATADGEMLHIQVREKELKNQTMQAWRSYCISSRC